MSKPSQKTLQEELNYEKAGEWELYYTLVNKAGKTFGMDINRFLVLNRSRD